MASHYKLLRRMPSWMRSNIREAKELTNFLAGVAALWFVWTSAAFAIYYIPSESMQPTLEVGDRIAVSKWAYGYSRHSLPLGLGELLPEDWDGRIAWADPRRGDVVVLQSPRADIVLIKRVAAIGGDVVEVRAGRLYINGEQAERELVDERRYREHGAFAGSVHVAHFTETLPQSGGRTHPIYERSDAGQLDDFGPVTVPMGHLFLMGDNRDHSVDSRHPMGPGFVPLANVIGRAETVVFTLNRCRRSEDLHCPTGRVWRGL
ncbi:signal peptidase I [Maricaulis sp.]|uniref:signal peptidase I n=1 Tax=Maricaulis sp. TaxID=1486257 RepID=UPI00262007B4|nr:signal peptidase I [Maricaulis sp.]